MNDFITISCPSCGGQLRRGANTTTYTCDYCGQQHHLRVEDIEEFGRCPVCHRNDRVEIVRAIYNKGGTLATRLAPPVDPSKEMVYNPPSKPPLSNKPLESTVKSKSTNIGIFLITFSMVLFSMLCCGAGIIDFQSETNVLIEDIILILSTIIFIVAIVFLPIGLFQDKKHNAQRDQILLTEWEKQNQETERLWSSNKEAYDAAYRKKSAQLANMHHKAIQRYDSLYYCHRDDCVFIPSESGYAPSAKIDEFLFTDPQENRSG